MEFERYVNLIRKSAHFYSKKWNIDYDELEAQGYLLYCECLTSYEVGKTEFSTYLTWQLRRLNDFCRTYHRQRGELIEDTFRLDMENIESKLSTSPSTRTRNSLDITAEIPAREELSSLAELLKIGLENLSSEAYAVFKWILERSWEKKGTCKPSISLAMKTFSLSKVQAEVLWCEIGSFYKKILLGL